MHSYIVERVYGRRRWRWKEPKWPSCHEQLPAETGKQKNQKVLINRMSHDMSYKFMIQLPACTIISVINCLPLFLFPPFPPSLPFFLPSLPSLTPLPHSLPSVPPSLPSLCPFLILPSLPLPTLSLLLFLLDHSPSSERGCSRFVRDWLELWFG